VHRISVHHVYDFVEYLWAIFDNDLITLLGVSPPVIGK
jgi:hypothetical protein